MDLRVLFGKELKHKVLAGKPKDEIGNWSFSFYFEHMLKIDSDFFDILITLTTMEEESEFEFPDRELLLIAEKLINGEAVDFEKLE